MHRRLLHRAKRSRHYSIDHLNDASFYSKPLHFEKSSNSTASTSDEDHRYIFCHPIIGSYLYGRNELLKKLVAILVIMGVLLQAFSQGVIIAQYYANKEYIAKNLCENRDKPQMHCNGKCCLKKKLANEGKEQNSTSPRTPKNEQDVTLFCSIPSIDIHYPAPLVVITKYFTRHDRVVSSYVASAFHPPTV